MNDILIFFGWAFLVEIASIVIVTITMIVRSFFERAVRVTNMKRIMEVERAIKEKDEKIEIKEADLPGMPTMEDFKEKFKSFLPNI
jgi:hypothetical protein